MSESYLPPPPPPPPSPSATAQVPAFDFAKPFSFIFEDPNWIPKILVGGLFYLLGFLIVGWFFLFGYCARLARNVIAGEPHPLPDWEDLGDYFGEGLALFGVALVYMLPALAVAAVFGIPAMIMGDASNESLQALGGGMMGCMLCLVVPLSLATTLLLPSALLRVIVERRAGAGFELRAVWAFIRANIGNYLLAIGVAIVARFLAGFGIFLFCIGVVFTGFWSFVITTHAFAQVHRFRERE